MVARELINKDMIAMTPTDTALDALSFMEEYKISHIAVVDGKHFIGLLSEEDVFNISNPESELQSHKSFLRNIFVESDQHIYEVMKKISAEHLSVLPVLDKNGFYEGIITLPVLIDKFAGKSAIDQPGGIIVLEMNENDYFVSQITQIVESNDTKILSFYIHSVPDSTKINLTLKLNKIDIRPVLQTLERFGYQVMSTYEDGQDDYLHERYDSLMKFLDI